MSRTPCWPPLLLALGLLSLSAGPVAAQNFDLYNLPKDAKALEWDWYTRDFRDLTFTRMAGPSPDYRLGKGDEVQVQIVGFQGPFNFKIRPNGSITIPLAGDVQVAGLTAEEAEAVIVDRFKERDLLKDPEVLVYIASYESKRFWVYGQIDRQGEYVMSQQLTLMDAIFIGGGLDFYGDRYGYLHRRGKGAAAGGTPARDALLESPATPLAGREVIKIDLQPMREGKLLSPNPLIEDGDVVVIPTRYPTVVYVLGDVQKAGAFQLSTDERLMVSQAVALAGGPGRTAKASGGFLVRYTEDGLRRQIPVDFSAIMQGRQRDFEVLPNDVIFIPGSKAKTLQFATLGAIPGVVASIPVQD